jgi:hypothetical protein
MEVRIDRELDVRSLVCRRMPTSKVLLGLLS